MLKKEKEYIENYGHIPDSKKDRLSYLLSTIIKNRVKIDIDEEIERIKKIKWKSLKFVIHVVPEGTPRPRLGKYGTFYVKGSSFNKRLMEKIIEENKDLSIIKTPVKFYCNSYFPIPKSMSNGEKLLAEMGFIRPISKPDWDNVGKGYCDMLTGLLLFDDSLVIEGVSRKFYSIKPRVEIKILYMEDYDSVYNKRKMIMK